MKAFFANEAIRKLLYDTAPNIDANTFHENELYKGNPAEGVLFLRDFCLFLSSYCDDDHDADDHDGQGDTYDQ